MVRRFRLRRIRAAMASGNWICSPNLGSGDPRATARLTGGWPAHRAPAEGKDWRLFLESASDDRPRAAALAVVHETAGDALVVAPPDPAALALFVHEAGPLPPHAATLALPDFHRAFPCRAPIVGRKGRKEIPPPPVIATPAYVLARLRHLGADRTHLIAWAREDELVLRASDLLAGRGAACRLAVTRAAAPPASPALPSGPDGEELRRTSSGEALLVIALHAPESAVRWEAADRAATANPASALGHLLHGVALAEAREHPGARDAFRRAIERDDSLAAAHFELGKTMIVLDDLEAALECFRQTTKTLPGFAPGWANAGAALGELERPEEALGKLERAADLDPLSHSLASNLGVTLRDLGRLAEAERAFRWALELAPDFVFGHYNLANAVYLQGRHREAVGLFEKAQAMDPSGSDRQRLLLAAARLAAGDVEDALRDYRAVFDSLEGQMRLDMRTVAQWDLRRLAERTGVGPGLKHAAEFVRSVRA